MEEMLFLLYSILDCCCSCWYMFRVVLEVSAGRVSKYLYSCFASTVGMKSTRSRFLETTIIGCVLLASKLLSSLDLNDSHFASDRWNLATLLQDGVVKWRFAQRRMCQNRIVYCLQTWHVVVVVQSIFVLGSHLRVSRMHTSKQAGTKLLIAWLFFSVKKQSNESPAGLL